MGVEVRRHRDHATPSKSQTPTSVDKKTIAEGVEDAATLTALKDRGVDFAQGFHLGRPKRLSPPSSASQGEMRLPQLPDATGARN
jgi:EAL domain-containing protein (putative c-di-GMP-specific phosphodiesterase class I)